MKKNNRTIKKYLNSCDSGKVNELHNNDCEGKNRKAKYRIYYLTGQDFNGEPYFKDWIDVCKNCKNDFYTDKNGNKIDEILAIEKIKKKVKI